LLSGLSAEALDVRYPRGQALPAMTPNSLTSRSRLRAQLDEVRRLGLAYDRCESNDAVRCVAAPVYDHGGVMVAAMSISAPTMRWNEPRQREWSDLVAGGAARLSARLGHRVPA
jgi:IclR family KDG regulon transcriptional repressor